MTTTIVLGWSATQVIQDGSCRLALATSQISGIKDLLEHAQTTNELMLDMTAEDLLLSQSYEDVLSKVTLTQGRWGVYLFKAVAVDEWDEEQTRLAYWGMGLQIGVAKPPSKAEEYLSDLRDVDGVYELSFQDFDKPDRRRCPRKGIQTNTVRDGIRGAKVSDEFLTFEKRQAHAFGMNIDYYLENPR